MMRGSEDDGPRVGLISSAVDGGVAQVVQAGLAEMAIRATEIRGDDGGPFDAVIVLVSLAAVHDQRWQERVAAITADRVVPVQLDAKAEFSMPSSLADRQWVPFSPSEPAVAVGAILVGLRNDEDLHKRRRRLEAEAAVWQQQGRESTLLIAGHLRASEAVALGDDLQAVGQAFSDTARAFVDTSQPYARRRRRNRRLIALTLVVTVALAIAGGLVLLPGVFQARTTQEAGFITTPDPSFVEQVPSWSALLAGELMIHPASEAQLLIAREILQSTLSRPWSLGVVASIDHEVLAAIPLSGGTTVVALLRRPSGITVVGSFDLSSGEWTWSAVVGEGYSAIDLGPREDELVVGGAGGIKVVDLAGQRVTTVSDEPVDDVVDGRDIIYAILPTGDAVAVDVAHGTMSTIGAFGTPLDVSRTSSGVRGVFSDGDGGYSVVALDEGGRFVARGTVLRPVIEAAVLSDDGEAAFVAGGDHQLWSIHREAPTPTGIAVPDRIGLLQRIAGGRLAVGGQAQPLRVFDAASGYELGDPCGDIGGPIGVAASADGDTMVCTNGLSASAWRTPLGPAGDLDGPKHTEPFENNAIVDVESAGSNVRFFFHTTGDLGHYTGWIPLARGSVSAVSVAPDASRILIGTDAGEAFVFAIGEGGVGKVVDWRVPDRSPVQAVGWGPEPVVFTTAGSTWRAPDCSDCGSDAGLLDVLRDRLPRCWSATQLSLVSSEVRQRLGVEACVPRAEGA